MVSVDRGAYRVLQVGCGPTGTSVLRQLLPRLAHAHVPVSYVVADPAVMGPGLAFATPYDLHVVNVRASAMSLHPDDRGEFARWRTEHESVWALHFGEPALCWHDYPPRRLFGMYLRSVFDEVIRMTDPAEQRVELIADRVVAVYPLDRGDRWRARFSSGRVAEYDRVILAVGHLPSAPYSPEEGGPRFLRDPWGLLDLPVRARVGVIGTRLTGVDAALALRERGHQGPVVLASRSGRLPSVKGRVAVHRLFHLPEFVAEQHRQRRHGTVSLEAVAEAIGREVQAAERSPIDWKSVLDPPPSTADTLRVELAIAESGQVVGWQSVLGSVVPWVPALWRLLDERSRERLMDTYVGIWAIRVASFPALSARRLLEMMDRGQLSVRSRLEAVATCGAGYEMRFADGDVIRVDAVINATGPGYGHDSLNALPLTRYLVSSGLAVPHRFGGLAVQERTFQAVDASGVTTQGLHVIGDLTRGVWLATNAVENTVRQSVMLADVLGEHIAMCSPR